MISLAGRFVVCLACATSVACHPQEQPVLAPSTDSLGYALHFGHQLTVMRDRVEDGVEATSVTVGLMRTFPDELKEPAWSQVGPLYREAAEEGRSVAHAEHVDEERVVTRFFTEEKDAVNGRTAGAATHAAKEGGCEVKLHGAISYGLKKAVEDQLRKRAEAHSTSHARLEEQADKLRKENIPRLEEQLSRIRDASHVVNYRLQMDAQALKDLAASASQAEETLQEHRESLQQAPGPADRARKERLEAVETALTELATARESIEATLDKAEQRKEQLGKDFNAALESLLADVEKRAAAAGT